MGRNSALEKSRVIPTNPTSVRRTTFMAYAVASTLREVLYSGSVKTIALATVLLFIQINTPFTSPK